MKHDRSVTPPLPAEPIGAPGEASAREVIEPLNVLENISELLGPLPGRAKWDFFTSPRGSLGDLSPPNVLREGNPAEVIRIARAFAEEHAR